MKYLITLLLSSIIISGCASTKPNEIIKTKIDFKYISIPEELMVCKKLPKININDIKNENDYNRLIVKPLYLNNKECFTSMDAIRNYNDNLKKKQH